MSGVQGYLSAPDEAGQIEIDGRTELYRDPDRGHRVVVAVEGSETVLGVADATVSRRQGEAPVVFEPAATCIEVHNQGNSNGLTVVTDGRTEEVPEGRMTTVERDATVSVGVTAELELVVERAASVTNVYHQGEGDVVTGDVTNVDRSTTVTDSVVNRSDIGGDDGEGAADVDDSVVNRSSLGGEDGASARSANGNQPGDRATDDASARTHRVCDDHGPYQGPVCPDCETERKTEPAASPGSAAESPTPNAGTEPASDPGESADPEEFCIYCGESVPAGAAFCPACGEQLPE